MLDVFNSFNIPYFALYGSLLGAITNNAILDGDDDIDLAIFEQDEYKLSEYRLLLPNGFTIIESNGTYQLLYLNGKIDIFILKPMNKQLFILKDPVSKQNHSSEWWTLNDIFPLQATKFGPGVIIIPNNYTRYLNEVYDIIIYRSQHQ